MQDKPHTRLHARPRSVNIRRMPMDLWDAVKERAQASGLNVREYVIEALRSHLKTNTGGDRNGGAT